MDSQVISGIIGLGGVIGVAVISGIVGVFKQGKEISAVQKTSDKIADTVKDNGAGIQGVKGDIQGVKENIREDIRDLGGSVVPDIKEIRSFVAESRALRSSASSGGVDPMRTIADIQAMADNLIKMQEKAHDREMELLAEIDCLKEENRQLKELLREQCLNRSVPNRELDEPEL